MKFVRVGLSAAIVFASVSCAGSPIAPTDPPAVVVPAANCPSIVPPNTGLPPLGGGFGPDVHYVEPAASSRPTPCNPSVLDRDGGLELALR